MKRAIAKKILVGQINNSEYVKKEGWEPSYLIVGTEQVSLANVMGIIIEKQEKMLVIDDGTGRIPIRFFETSLKPELIVGDAVQVIGRVGEHDSTKFLTCQAISKIDINWLKVRKEEVKIIDFNKPIKKVTEEVVVEDVYSAKDNVVEKIRRMDSGEGVEITQLTSDGTSEKAVQTLLEEGEIFEIRPGKVKVLE